MRRYGWLVLAIAVVTVLIGVWRVSVASPLFSATSSMVLDPLATDLAGLAQDRPDLPLGRYVSDQVIILGSRSVADRAAEVAADQLGATPGPLTAEDLMDQAEFSVGEDSNVVQIRFLAEDPTEAVVGANSLALAYQEVRRDEIEAATQAAVERVDMLLQSVETELAEIEDQISELRIAGTEGHPIMEGLEEQLAGSLLRLLDLQEQLADADDPAAEATIRDEIDEILLQVSIFQAFRSLDEPTPELQGLMRIQETLIDQRSELSQQRDALAVGADLSSSGVVSYLPAESAVEVENADLLRDLILIVLLGALIGAMVAFLATRRPPTEDPPSPEAERLRGRHTG